MGHVGMVRVPGTDQGGLGQRMHRLTFVPRPGPGAAHVEMVAQCGPVGQVGGCRQGPLITSAMGERQMFPVQTNTTR
jgi:hypothetical protein